MPERRRLRELLAGIAFEVLAGDVDVEIAAISTDSRGVAPGALFICLSGYQSQGGETRADRHQFAATAIAAGAVAVVVERAIVVPAGVTLVRVADSWEAVSRIACQFYRQPSSQLTAVGITGTSGKTSTAYFTEAVLAAAGRLPACLGTIEYRFAGRRLPAHQTTPEAPELQRLLREAVDAGCKSLVMEVSSHALELRRVGGVAFDVAIFTNLSQDHLNFHPDMHHYRRAKGRLFQELASGGKPAVAVINADDPHAGYMIEVNRGALLTYGTAASADVRAENIRTGLDGSVFDVRTPREHARVGLRQLGDFQVHNALAAIAAGTALGYDLEFLRRAVAAAPEVPGRFELVDCGQPFRVVVDYAHKPDALARLLACARGLQPKRVITVFGCGGDRDRSKRPMMGEIAARLSDLVVVTSDNPRSEAPEAIIADIVAGVGREAAAQVLVEPERRLAIGLAIAAATRGDIVLILGKGHETYQLIGDQRHDFDDRVEARAHLMRLAR